MRGHPITTTPWIRKLCRNCGGTGRLKVQVTQVPNIQPLYCPSCGGMGFRRVRAARKGI